MSHCKRGKRQSLPKDHFGKDWYPRDWRSDDVTQNRAGLCRVLWVTRHRDYTLLSQFLNYAFFFLLQNCSPTYCCQWRLISLQGGRLQLSSLAWRICQAAVLFIQVCQRPAVTSSHSPMCELKYAWPGSN